MILSPDDRLWLCCAQLWRLLCGGFQARNLIHLSNFIFFSVCFPFCSLVSMARVTKRYVEASENPFREDKSNLNDSYQLARTNCLFFNHCYKTHLFFSKFQPKVKKQDAVSPTSSVPVNFRNILFIIIGWTVGLIHVLGDYVLWFSKWCHIIIFFSSYSAQLSSQELTLVWSVLFWKKIPNVVMTHSDMINHIAILQYRWFA
jgi:hypothetical protein